MEHFVAKNGYQTMSFTDDELIDRIVEEMEVTDLDELLVDLASEIDGPGGCVRCGDVFVHVLVDQTSGWCDECGEESIKSLLVLAGVV